MSFGSELSRAWVGSDFQPQLLANFLMKSVRLFFVGNGGSAAIASHMATDFSKNGDMTTMCFNDGASLTCLANDLGYEKVFSHPLHKHIRGPDCLIAISSSGKSPNILAAASIATQRGADVVTLTGFDPDNPLRTMGNQNLYVPSSDYGIVETIHLGMLHAALREIINAR